MNIEQWAPDKIRPYERNPRKNDAAVERVARLIEEYGFRNPIEVDADGVILRGHTRWKAAQRLGMETVPVIVTTDLSFEQARAWRIADNASQEWAEWDMDLLGDEVAELQAADFDLSLTGLDDDMLGSLTRREPADGAPDPGADVSRADELREKWQTARGQLWTIGPHRLMCGDSGNTQDVERLMDGRKAGLYATDPPYGVDYTKTKNGIPRSGFKNAQEHWGDIANDGLRDDQLQGFLENVFRTCLPHLDHAAWYLWHAHLTAAFFAAAAAAAADVLLHRQIIWRKPGFVLTRSGMYHWQHEPCFYGWVRGQQPKWLGDKSQTSVWDIGRDDDSGQHPTQKPAELFAIPMRNHLEPGEIALEAFGGSGSQLVAANRTGRICYAMELEPRYVAVALERLSTMGLEPELT